MTLEEYLIFAGAILLCAIFSGVASILVNSTFKKYAKVGNQSRMTGYDTAVKLLRAGGVTDIRVQRVSGMLTDHYHPTKKVVNLRANNGVE